MEAARGDSKVDGGGVVHAVGGVGARLEHRHTFVAGCQRLPPDLQPNVASAGGNRPIHPNHGSGVAPKGLGGGLGAAAPDVGARRRAPGAPAVAPFGVSEVGDRVRRVHGKRGR